MILRNGWTGGSARCTGQHFLKKPDPASVPHPPPGIAAHPLVFPPPHGTGRDILGSGRLAHVAWLRPVLPVGREACGGVKPWGRGQMVPICWAQRQVSGVCMDLASWGRQTAGQAPGLPICSGQMPTTPLPSSHPDPTAGRPFRCSQTVQMSERFQ